MSVLELDDIMLKPWAERSVEEQAAAIIQLQAAFDQILGALFNDMTHQLHLRGCPYRLVGHVELIPDEEAAA